MSNGEVSFKSIGSNLRSLREEAELTLKEVALAVHLDVSLLSKLERGVRLPTEEQCHALADFYGLAPDVLAKERLLSKVYSDLKKQARIDPKAGRDLLEAILKECCPQFVPGAEILYIRGVEGESGHCNAERLKELGFEFAGHGKMPDVVAFFREKGWLILIESVLGNGLVDAKRHAELAELFSSVTPGIVYVTAFPDRSLMARYLSVISWETEVWVADAPDHLIHFNGERFLGPYGE